jgi:amino acid adenylation domain-containing protein
MSQSEMTLPETQGAWDDAREGAFVCELSAAQERFWILDRLIPGNPALNVAVRWQLDGVVVPDIVERAFQSLVQRHETLRTQIHETAAGPVQRVLAEAPFRLASVDLLALPEADRAAMALQLGAREAATPFDLATAPLLRATLLRVTERRSILLVTAHHIVCDGWSIGLLARDFGESYAALRRGATPALPDLPIQYADYALWQSEARAGQTLQPQIDHWVRQLAGLRYFELPTDFPRPAMQTTGATIRSVLLPRGVTDRLVAWSRQQGATFFMTSLAALLALLHRYTGETDIAIGTQIAGRDQPELQDLVGLFINTVVLRTDLSGDPGFIALVGRVQAVVRDAFAHQAVPLETLIEVLKPERDLSRNALFSVNFIHQRSFISNRDYGDFALVDLPSQSAGALYDLNFFMVERPDGWRFSCELNTGLFRADTVDALLAAFQTLLEGAAADPALALSELPVLDAATRKYLVQDCNATQSDYPGRATVIDLIAAQARLGPDYPAVACGGRAMTRRQLAEASDRLAGVLQRRGVAPGALVGLCCERSCEMLVALLAILKAGAAYVPLDPAYPPARLVHAVADSGLRLVLTEAGLTGLFAQCDAETLVWQDALEAAAGPQAALARPEPGALAYVIYTSGSTGRPKGAQIPHRALTNLLCAMQRTPGLAPQDTLLAVTSLSFDIAALELFLPLTTGARLVIATRAEASDGAVLKALLRRSAATVMQATPATWQMLLDVGWTAAGLRMLCGGEALPRRLADRLLAGGGTLWNMYGPTETTIWSAAVRVGAGEGAVPIGGPIANTQFHVLDARGALVLPGAPGELHIGGDGLALGYWRNPRLTGERFIRHPLAVTPDGRLYRTGDLVRRLPDGCLAFLGRADTQVKLRGFRIELGDIEAAMLADPRVAAAAAVVRSDAAGEGRLIAYMVPAAGEEGGAQAALASGVREALAAALPAYMVPALIVVLPALPLTPNGKVDRAALPAPLPPVRAAGAPSVMTDPEQRIAAVWRDLLGVAEIGPETNFFELGGHSLLAVRMLARLGDVLGHSVSLASLFQAPTVRGLASLLPAPADASPPAAEVPRTLVPRVVVVQPHGSKPPIFAINNTGIFYHLARGLGEDQPFIALQVFDSDVSDAAPGDFVRIAASYTSVIRSLQPHGPYSLLGLCVAGTLAYEIAQQLTAAGEEVALLVIVDSWAPGYLRRLTLRRRLLADLSYRWQRLGHHIANLGKADLTATIAFYLERPGVLRARMRLARLGRRAGLAAMPVFADKDWRFLERLYAAMVGYAPRRYAGRVLLLHRPDQPRGRFLDPGFGWSDLVTGPLEVVCVPGDHLGMFRDPGAAIMVEHIRAVLG